MWSLKPKVMASLALGLVTHYVFFVCLCRTRVGREWCSERKHEGFPFLSIISIYHEIIFVKGVKSMK